MLSGDRALTIAALFTGNRIGGEFPVPVAVAGHIKHLPIGRQTASALTRTRIVPLPFLVRKPCRSSAVLLVRIHSPPAESPSLSRFRPFRDKARVFRQFWDCAGRQGRQRRAKRRKIAPRSGSVSR